MKTASFLLLCCISSFSEALSAPSKAIQALANGMNLLKPAFVAEANLQASLLGSSVDETSISKNLDAMKKTNKVLIYTYGLSPFSKEALSILDGAGCDYTNVELGPEWFLLGGEESKTRVLLSNEVDSGATSLPKVFIGGKCIGGCAELSALAEGGELQTLLNKAGALKKGQNKGLFSFL